jgi:hypothetical protein
MPYLWTEIKEHLGVHRKLHDILTVKNAMVISIYYVMEYLDRPVGFQVVEVPRFLNNKHIKW